MTAHQGVRVNSLTTGTPSHKFEHLRKDYVYRGSKKDGPTPPSQALGGLARTYGREQRVARFAAALAAAGQGGQDIPLSAVLEAGASVGVGEKTARSYLAQLRRQQQGGSDD